MNGAELSLWDRFKIAITPKSHAEAIVDSMYSPENRGMVGLPGFTDVPEYESESASTPAFIVETKQAAVRAVESVITPFKQAATTLASSIKKYLIIAFIGLALLVAIYAFAGGWARR